MEGRGDSWEMAGWQQPEQDTDRDRFMSSYEAREYGLIDEVITSRTPLPLEESRRRE